jgi:hypothetical protein
MAIHWLILREIYSATVVGRNLNRCIVTMDQKGKKSKKGADLMELF